MPPDCIQHVDSFYKRSPRQPIIVRCTNHFRLGKNLSIFPLRRIEQNQQPTIPGGCKNEAKSTRKWLARRVPHT